MATNEEQTIDAAVSTDLEIGAALVTIRQNRVSRIETATREIPIKYAQIKKIEEYIEMFKTDREWCVESLKTVDARIAALEDG